ncbi:MAG: hypothetical protein MZV64_28120 [Ignavibacteriales bacterium]|nr:hypothetical protein [Ignavibacteriales bacterium]
MGFDWHPATKELWFTDNGRDMMGDDLPPDELNRAPANGLHFGFPYCHGGDDRRPGVRRKQRVRGVHAAGAGARARTSRRWACVSTPGRCSRARTATRSSSPSTARGTAARRSATAIMLVRARREPRHVATRPSPRAGCRDGKPWGRPVDVLVMPDGALLVSDDHAGRRSTGSATPADPARRPPRSRGPRRSPTKPAPTSRAPLRVAMPGRHT